MSFSEQRLDSRAHHVLWMNPRKHYSRGALPSASSFVPPQIYLTFFSRARRSLLFSPPITMFVFDIYSLFVVVFVDVGFFLFCSSYLAIFCGPARHLSPWRIRVSYGRNKEKKKKRAAAADLHIEKIERNKKEGAKWKNEWKKERGSLFNHLIVFRVATSEL